MDSAKWQDNLNVLKLMWKNDQLSSQKLMYMLETAIEKEVQKPDDRIDTDFIDSCNSILWELLDGDSYPQRSRKKEDWKIIHKAMRKSNSAIIKRRFVWGAGIALAFSVCLLVLTVLLPNGRVDTYVTSDEQLYVVKGEVNEKSLMPAAMAELGENEFLDIQTMDINAVAEFFGFLPPIPQYIPQGWALKWYEGSISQTDWIFLMVLRNESEEHNMTYQITSSITYNGFDIAYAQNEAGEYINLPNGQKGYLAYNIDDVLITWVDGLTCYDVYGPITSDEALRVIESIH